MICDMVTELVAAPGTGSIATGTPVSGRFSFAQAITAGIFALTQQIYIIINNGAQWEVVESTVGSGSLSRDTVLLNSSNTQPSKINFTTTPCYVYPYIPSLRSVYRNAAGNLAAAYDISSPTQNGGPLAGTRNRLINSAFQINQRAFGGGALSAGIYGHDRWKAGAGGCTYTASGSPFGTITITAGTLQQVIEADAIEGGTYTLSWSGTATARVDSGAYAVSPITVTGLSAGATHTIEFNTGTVLKPQFECGVQASQWEVRLPAAEKLMCDRFYNQDIVNCAGYGAAGATAAVLISLPTFMRASPSLTLTSVLNTNSGTNALTVLTNRNLKLSTVVTALGTWAITAGTYSATAEL